MKIKSGIPSDAIFTRVINDLIIKDSCADTSYVCIILTFSSHSDKSLLPTVKVNNDIREYLCNAPTKGYVGNFVMFTSKYKQPMILTILNLKKIQLLLVNKVKDSDVDELVYKLTCNIGLKYKCAWCSYIHKGIVKKIQL